jgi:hypothetical protein
MLVAGAVAPACGTPSIRYNLVVENGGPVQVSPGQLNASKASSLNPTQKGRGPRQKANVRRFLSDGGRQQPVGV